MAYCQGICGERLEFLSVFIREFEVICVHSILLESDSEGVKNCIVVLEFDLIRLLFESQCLLHVDCRFSFDHSQFNLKISY